jgi:CheY-like chemotaxis protein
MVVLEMLYDKKTDTLSIHVRDTGIGISKEAKKNLFKPFQQASKNISSQYGGTGLGLSISKKLADLLGGELTLESREGEGTTFTLKIPCHTIPGTPPFLDFDFDKVPYTFIVEGTKSKHRYVTYYERYFKELNLPHEVITPTELIKRDIDQENSVLIGIRLDYEDETTLSLLKKYHESTIILETQLFAKASQIPSDVTILDMPVFPQKLFKAILNIREEESQGTNQKKKSDKRILLVDDSLINLKLMHEVSTRLGATPYTASDGKEAIELFEKNDVDVILIDQNMPVINGADAIRKIRSLPKGKTVSIYGLTGDSDSETLQQMIDAGADAILTKPVQLDKLRQILTD